MRQKLLVPVAALVLAVIAVIAVWYLMAGDGTHTATPGDNQQAKANAAPDAPRPLNPADFDAARIQPDPVTSQRPPQPFTAPKTGPRIVVQGRVVDENGAGIPDARVTFNGEGKLVNLHGVGYTDPSGSYCLLAWATGQSRVMQGQRQGRIAAETPQGRVAVSDLVTIADAPTADMPDLAVRDGARISGQVLTTDGTPAPGAKITARSAGPVDVATVRGRTPDRTHRQLVTTTWADESGRFSFEQLPAGHYRLEVEAGYFGRAKIPTMVNLVAFKDAWKELRVSNENFLRGVLKDQSGQPVAGAVVRLVSGGGEMAKPPRKPGPDRRDDDSKLSAFRAETDPRVKRFNDAAHVRPLDRHRAVTDSAGRFGFGPLPDVPFTVVSKLGDAEARVKDAHINQPDCDLQIDVKTSISGKVRDAQTRRAVENFDARVMTGADTEVTPFDRVSDKGRFEYHPGGVYLAPNPPLKDATVRISAPGYVPAFVAAGELREGDARRDLDVALKPLCRLTFDLLHDGHKLDLEPVAMLFDDRLAYEASSDTLGRVVVPGVAPATYKVKVVLADDTELQGTLVVPAQHEATLELKLS